MGQQAAQPIHLGEGGRRWHGPRAGWSAKTDFTLEEEVAALKPFLEQARQGWRPSDQSNQTPS